MVAEGENLTCSHECFFEVYDEANVYISNDE